MANISHLPRTIASVPTPEPGYITIFTDSADLRPKYINSDRVVADYIGPRGFSGTVEVGSVTTVASNIPADVTNVGTANDAILDFIIPRGKSITNIARTSGTGAENTTDTYTITYDDADTDTFTVYNGSDGRSITNIARTSGTGAPGTTDTYTITYSKSPLTSTFTVYNGANGTGTGTAVTPQAVGNTGSAGTAGPEYANPDHVHAHGNQTSGTHHAVVTTSVNGFMSASDKTKLDGVQSGAQVNAVTTVFGRAGAVVAQQSDYDGFFTTPAEAAAAAPVQSVNVTKGLKRTELSGAITLASKYADFFFYATDYGNLTDGSDVSQVGGAQATENTQTIQAAINFAASAAVKKPGGIVILPPGTFHIDATLTINTTSVKILGAGRKGNSDVGSQTGHGTTLFWNNIGSSATTAMIDCVSIQGASNQAVKGIGVEGVNLQCAGNVGIGLRVKSIHWGVFKDIYVINATSKGLVTECFVTGVELGEAADVTKCTFDNIGVRMLEVSDSAVGYSFEGATNANTSNSTFRNLACSCFGAQLAMDLRNTDSNRFYDITINQSNGGTVQPIRLRGGTAAGLESRGNIFFYLAAGGSSSGVRGMYSEGTEIAGVTAPAKNNAVYGYSIENGEPYPIIGTGSALFYQIVGGTQPFKLNAALLADTAFTNAVIPTVASLVIPANALTPGTTFEFTMAGSVINTTAASNLVCDILINGTAVATTTLALGTTAAAAPGRGFWYEGAVTFRSVGATATVASNGRIDVAALSNGSNQTAATAINTTAAVTLALRINTSAATSTGTLRQATIIQGN